MLAERVRTGLVEHAQDALARRGERLERLDALRVAHLDEQPAENASPVAVGVRRQHRCARRIRKYVLAALNRHDPLMSERSRLHLAKRWDVVAGRKPRALGDAG